MSGFMTQVIACALQLGGMPVPKGGGVALVDGLAAIVRDAGGELRTDADVERIVVSDGQATAVRLADGETIRASRASSPASRRRSSTAAPRRRRRAGRRPRARSLPLRPRRDADPHRDERAAALARRRAARAHAAPPPHPGLDGVSRAVNEADRGLLPAEATIALGQPMAVDPSRAPEGSWVLWVQLQELPPRPKGDAAGELDVGDGTWTEELREAYADRIVERIGRHIENLELGDGRPASSCPPRTWRPRTRTGSAATSTPAPARSTRTCSSARPRDPRPRTPVEQLWHIGASTHPGPGLGAGSGYLVAKQLTSRRSPAAAAREGARPAVTLSLSEISTVGASFAEDVRAYAAAGFDGIGIWEMKLGDDDADLEALRASGLARDELRPDRALDPAERGHRGPGRRRGAHRVDVRVAAPARRASSPTASSASPARPGGRDEAEARRLVVDGLRDRRRRRRRRASGSGSSRSTRRSATR